jgi:hypothetical protein
MRHCICGEAKSRKIVHKRGRRICGSFYLGDKMAVSLADATWLPLKAVV